MDRDVPLWRLMQELREGDSGDFRFDEHGSYLHPWYTHHTLYLARDLSKRMCETMCEQDADSEAAAHARRAARLGVRCKDFACTGTCVICPERRPGALTRRRSGT